MAVCAHLASLDPSLRTALACHAAWPLAAPNPSGLHQVTQPAASKGRATIAAAAADAISGARSVVLPSCGAVAALMPRGLLPALSAILWAATARGPSDGTCASAVTVVASAVAAPWDRPLIDSEVAAACVPASFVFAAAAVDEQTASNAAGPAGGSRGGLKGGLTRGLTRGSRGSRADATFSYLPRRQQLLGAAGASPLGPEQRRRLLEGLDGRSAGDTVDHALVAAWGLLTCAAAMPDHVPEAAAAETAEDPQGPTVKDAAKSNAVRTNDAKDDAREETKEATKQPSPAASPDGQLRNDLEVDLITRSALRRLLDAGNGLMLTAPPDLPPDLRSGHQTGLGGESFEGWGLVDVVVALCASWNSDGALRDAVAAAKEATKNKACGAASGATSASDSGAVPGEGGEGGYGRGMSEVSVRCSASCLAIVAACGPVGVANRLGVIGLERVLQLAELDVVADTVPETAHPTASASSPPPPKGTGPADDGAELLICAAGDGVGDGVGGGANEAVRGAGHPSALLALDLLGRWGAGARSEMVQEAAINVLSSCAIASCATTCVGGVAHGAGDRRDGAGSGAQAAKTLGDFVDVR